MIYFKNTLDFTISEPSVITLGKFDGLHRGHEKLMAAMKEESAAHDLKTVVFTFNIPPRNRFNNKENLVLTTNEEKHLVFEECGVDYLVECPFTPEVMHMEPEAFIDWIVKALNVRVIIAGSDFHFGYKAAGDQELLKQCQEKYGYRAIILDKLQENGKDISSTYVREEIAAGHIEKANHLLGYEYFLKCRIIHGRALGRTIGIPTINMAPPENKLLPPFGVYVTRVLIGDRSFKGVSNVGRKPTVGNNNPIGVETFILDFDEDVYDQVLTVQFLKAIRPEMKFPTIDALCAQMNHDIQTAEQYYRQLSEEN